MSNAIYPHAVRGLTWPVMMSPEDSTIVQTAPSFHTTRIAQTRNPQWHASLIYEYIKDSPYDLVPSLSPYTDYQTLQGFWLARNAQFDSFLIDCQKMLLGPEFYLVGPSIRLPLTYYPPGAVVIDPAGHKQTVLQWGTTSSSTNLPFNDGGGRTVDGQVLWQDGGAFPGAAAQTLQLVTDGTDWFSPLQRNFGGQFLEDITDINAANIPLRVWANGVLQTFGVDYTIGGPGLAIPGYSFMGLYIAWNTGTSPPYDPATPITASCQFYMRMRFETDQQDFEIFLKDLWTIGGSEGKNGSGLLKMVSARPESSLVPVPGPGTVGPSVMVPGSLTFLGAATGQFSQPTTGPTVVTVTIPNTILAGDLIVVDVELIQKWGGVGVFTVNNGGDSFTNQIGVDSSGGNQTVVMFSAISAGGAGAATVTVSISLAKNLRIVARAYRSNTGFTGSILGVYGGNGTGWAPTEIPLPTAPLTLFVAACGWQGIGTFTSFLTGAESTFWNKRLENNDEKSPPFTTATGYGEIAAFDRAVIPGDHGISVNGIVGGGGYTASFIVAGVAFPCN